MIKNTPKKIKKKLIRERRNTETIINYKFKRNSKKSMKDIKKNIKNIMKRKSIKVL